ncbi:MAG: hypothetical protein H3C47_07975 [Candidatus Cloacimonetes bacterium]|nr:hypothetical protein [Candidatus Cloacimonadota bacterium]
MQQPVQPAVDTKPKRIESIVTPLKEILKDFEVREAKGRRPYIGFGCTHFPDTSQALSGFRKGVLHVINGSARRGRTQVLLELAISYIKTNKQPVLFLSFHRPPRELLFELLSRESGMDMETVHYKKVVGDSSRKEKLKTSLDRLAKYQSYLHLITGAQTDTTSQIEKLVHEIRAALKTRDILLVVDSLQSIAPSAHSGFNPGDTVVRSMKSMAMHLDIPIILGSEISQAGEELDEKEGRDRVNLSHATGISSLSDLTDVGISMTKNHIDSLELKKLLAKQAENLGKDQIRLPELEVVDLLLEKVCRGAMVSHQAIQLMVSQQNGKVLELGVKLSEDIHRFHRIEKSILNLIERQEIEFYEFDPNASPSSSSASGTDTAMPGMPSAAGMVKPKPKIALRKD